MSLPVPSGQYRIFELQRHIARRRDFSYADWQRQRTAMQALLAARARGVSLL
jgi:hypothetical protein